jgi:exosortase A-associated hydrolase 2
VSDGPRPAPPAVPDISPGATSGVTGPLRETPLYFPSGDHSLYGVLHEPAEPSNLPSFVFCHPLAEEKLWTYRILVVYARRLAALGHAVLRFDYMGNGDSTGRFSDSSLETELADVHAAIREVRHRVGQTQVGLLGLRLGATVAALAAEQASSIGPLILWAPIVDGGRYMQEALRTNLTTQMATFKEVRYDRAALVEMMEKGATVNIDGYEMGHALFSSFSGVKLAADAKTHAGPCLVVNIERQPGKPAPDLDALTARYAQGTLAFAQEEPFWREIAKSYQEHAPALFDVTTEWLRGLPR